MASSPPADSPPDTTSWCALPSLTRLIEENMPITQHLQFSLFRDAAERLIATAPLSPNANHYETAFGGSLSMLATIAGWAMTHLVLRERDCCATVVIQESRINFHRPVEGNLVLACARPSAEREDSFFEMLERWGRARLPVSCAIQQNGTPAFVFDGSYVALAE